MIGSGLNNRNEILGVRELPKPRYSIHIVSLASFFVLVGVAAWSIDWAIKQPTQEPTLESFVEYTFNLSAHQLVVSFPSVGLQPTPYVYDWNFTNRNIDIENEEQPKHYDWEYGGWPVAERHWKWRLLSGPTAAIHFSIHVVDVSESIRSEGGTFVSRLIGDHQVRHDNAIGECCGLGDSFIPLRVKDSVRFEPSEVKWLRHDYVLSSDGESYSLSEDFAVPLDDKHVLVFRFELMGYDDTFNGREFLISTDGIYPHAEYIADEIMKSVSIKRNGEIPTISYGVPDHGDVVGKVRYHDRCSQRDDPYEGGTAFQGVYP